MNEEKDILVEDNSEKDIDLSTMTREEIEDYALKQAKAYNDQRGLNDKLKSKLKEVETTKVEEPKEETKPPVVTPDTEKPKEVSLDEQYEIASLSSNFSLEEIREAKSFVGTSFGATLTEVANSSGFLAHINTKRELSKSDSMISSEPLKIEKFQTTNQFIQDVESGVIDITVDKEAYKKYVEIKAEQKSKAGY